MARKTFNVFEFKDYVNSKLVLDHVSDDEKYGLIAALEHVLHETENYKGFGYVYKDDVRPEMWLDDVCNPAWDKSRDMRRKYY